MGKLTRCARWVLGWTLLALAPAVPAALILNSATQGLYNNALGISLDTSGASDPFPCANVACGDAAVSFPTAPNLSAAAAALGAWLTTPATPGGSWVGPQPIPFGWTVNTETAIIYQFDALNGLTNVDLDLGVDNGNFVWLDGVYKFGARAGGGASLGEYSPRWATSGRGRTTCKSCAKTTAEAPGTPSS